LPPSTRECIIIAISQNFPLRDGLVRLGRACLLPLHALPDLLLANDRDLADAQFVQALLRQTAPSLRERRWRYNRLLKSGPQEVATKKVDA
jgi:hypothetical protein